jgi:hypothetical protein
MNQPQVAPDAATEIPASEELANETPDIATPETTEDPLEQTATQDDPADKSLKRMERRINRVSAARYQAEAVARQAREESEALKARLAQYEQPAQSPRQQQQVDPMALAREIAHVERVTEKSNDIVRVGQKSHQDFMPTVKVLAEEVGELFDEVGRPKPVMEAVLDSDKPAELLYFLGKNPDLASELVGLSPAQLGRRIARLETQMAEQAKPKTSAAPRPLDPVRGGSSDNELRSDLSTDEWMRRREKQLKERR